MRVIVLVGFALALLGVPVASAQQVLPAQCPFGYVHQGPYCVQYEGGHFVRRIPFHGFIRGGGFMHGRVHHR